MKKRLFLAIPILVVLGGGAVTALFGTPWLEARGLLGEERRVLSRMNAYWQARVENDLESVARYQHPRQRSVMNPGLLVTESYRIENLHVGGKEATAQVTLVTRLKHPRLSSRTRETTLNERWIGWNDGNWYRELKPETLTQSLKQQTGAWPPPEPQESATDAPQATEEPKQE